MEPINFKESNRVLKKPEGIEEDCEDMYSWTDGRQSASCWKPTFKERIRILFGCPIWVVMLSGNSQPPMYMDVKKTIFNNE